MLAGMHCTYVEEEDSGTHLHATHQNVLATAMHYQICDHHSETIFRLALADANVIAGHYR